MRRISVDDLEPGQELAGSVKIPSARDGVLYRLKLDAGTRLTEKHIDRLKRLGINRVPVEDPATDDIDRYVYDEEVEAAEEDVRSSFQTLTSDMDDGRLDEENINQLRSAVSSLIESLKDSEVMAAFTNLKTHDNYTAEHSLDVAKISLQLALKFENEFKTLLKQESGASSQYINQYMLEDLGLGAMLHDLGKRSVPSEVLNKDGSLNDDEWSTMTSHPEEGFQELQEVSFALRAPVKTPALQHHEQYDGSGYPKQLEGKEIHLFGRLTACADVYSALTSNRPYRGAQSPSEALAIMKSMQEEGPHFDPDIFQKFLTVVLPYPIGQEITLNDGRSGVVVDVDPDHPLRPTVRLFERGDERLEDHEEIPLSDASDDLRIKPPPPEPSEGFVR
jgi:HD-GYP domain-containing protein (c-di-GMP phosphodiesterase class II)